MSTAMSATGILAAGTADGHLWIGPGSQKGLAKIRFNKWNGLADGGKRLYTKVANGPIVAMSFSTPTTLTASTLMGSIIQWEVNHESDAILKEVWRKEALGLEKVNALVSNEKKIVIAGFAKDGKGIIEIWDKPAPVKTSS